MLKKFILLLGASVLVFSSCTTLKTNSIHYQSIRKVYAYDDIENSNIMVATVLSAEGELTIGISNRSDKIMTIDMTRSFVITTYGESFSFYDPTIKVESTTVSTSKSQGNSVNLGAVAGALGIGGKVGTLMNGVNVSSGNASAVSNTTTTYLSEMPQVSLAPHATGAMPKVYDVDGGFYSNGQYIGKRILMTSRNNTYKEYSMEEAPRFGLVISWSIDDGKTYEKFEQWYYFNADFSVPVIGQGQLNSALRKLMMTKTDCINEQWWIIYTEHEDVWGDYIMPKGVYPSVLSVDYQ